MSISRGSRPTRFSARPAPPMAMEQTSKAMRSPVSRRTSRLTGSSPTARQRRQSIRASRTSGASAMRVSSSRYSPAIQPGTMPEYCIASRGSTRIVRTGGEPCFNQSSITPRCAWPAPRRTIVGPLSLTREPVRDQRTASATARPQRPKEVRISRSQKRAPKQKWCRLEDSNPWPDDYKSTALPTELNRPDAS